MASLLLVFFRGFFYYFFQIRSSLKYHSTILSTVMSSFLRFFDLNPAGRIINRFSRDTSILDSNLPQVLFEFFQILLMIIAGMGLAVYINYWVAIVILPLFLICMYIRHYFLASLNELKRLEGTRNNFGNFKIILLLYNFFFSDRSPIFIHVNNSLGND
jgi:ABC-type multidrug transport system fused ATPase/permease subunit